MTAAFALGCDVVDVNRFGAALVRRPGLVTRLFTAREQEDVTRDGVDVYSPVAQKRYAARFAAKEATRKALSDRGLAWQAIAIHTGSDGAPTLHINGVASALQVSLSHDGAVAFAVVAGMPDV